MKTNILTTMVEINPEMEISKEKMLFLERENYRVFYGQEGSWKYIYETRGTSPTLPEALRIASETLKPVEK